MSDRNGERYYDAELWRLKVSFESAGQDGEAECCFLRAVEIARQQAPSLELRASTSLAASGRRMVIEGKRRKLSTVLVVY